MGLCTCLCTDVIIYITPVLNMQLMDSFGGCNSATLSVLYGACRSANLVWELRADPASLENWGAVPWVLKMLQMEHNQHISIALDWIIIYTGIFIQLCANLYFLKLSVYIGPPTAVEFQILYCTVEKTHVIDRVYTLQQQQWLRGYGISAVVQVFVARHHEFKFHPADNILYFFL